VNRQETIAALRRLPRYGWPPHYPLVQFPNAPLAVAFAAMATEQVTDGEARDVAHAVASLGLAIWAYWELTEGDNGFRRVLGVAGLGLALFRLV
jgi:hypothetical protein